MLSSDSSVCDVLRKEGDSFAFLMALTALRWLILGAFGLSDMVKKYLIKNSCEGVLSGCKAGSVHQVQLCDLGNAMSQYLQVMVIGWENKRTNC